MAGAVHLESPGIRATYDTWADTYPSVAHNPLMRLEQEIVESILMTLRPSRALDVGTGSGRYPAGAGAYRRRARGRRRLLDGDAAQSKGVQTPGLTPLQRGGRGVSSARMCDGCRSRAENSTWSTPR